MFYDGLQSPWDGQLMGCFAEATAAKYGFTREEQDAYAAGSVRRALRAVGDGEFGAEVVPVTVKGRKGEIVIDRDETPFTCDLSKIPTLRPAFSQGDDSQRRTPVEASSFTPSPAGGFAALARVRRAFEHAGGPPDCLDRTHPGHLFHDVPEACKGGSRRNRDARLDGQHRRGPLVVNPRPVKAVPGL